MATLRKFTTRPHRSTANLIVNTLVVGWMAIMLFLVWPMLRAELGTRLGWMLGAAPAVEIAPTLAPAARYQAQQAAPATASEAQAVNQAVPTENVALPPLLPVQATAAAVHQASTLDDVAPAALSPVDLVWLPIPTPTTMLSQEQFEASQASEEQHFIDGQLQGLAPAQQMVRVHEAEGNAQP